MNPLVTARLLAAKYENGEIITQDDVNQAIHTAKASGRIEERVLISHLKRRLEEIKAGTFTAKTEDEQEKPKITEDDVKAAYEKSKTTHHIDDQVRYAVLKRQYEMQEGSNG